MEMEHQTLQSPRGLKMRERVVSELDTAQNMDVIKLCTACYTYKHQCFNFALAMLNRSGRQIGLNEQMIIGE
jgi:hypothetical protein